MIDQGSINNQTVERLNNELMLDSPNPLGAAIQFPMGIQQSPFSVPVLASRQPRLTVARLKEEENLYRVTGGYFEYTPVQFKGVPLDYTDVPIEPNSKVVVRCQLKWKFASYSWTYDNFGTPVSGVDYYLTGEYRIIEATLLIVPQSTVLPATDAAAYSTVKANVDKTNLKHIQIASINEAGDVSIDLQHRVIYLSSAFNIQ